MVAVVVRLRAAHNRDRSNGVVKMSLPDIIGCIQEAACTLSGGALKRQGPQTHSSNEIDEVHPRCLRTNSAQDSLNYLMAAPVLDGFWKHMIYTSNHI